MQSYIEIKVPIRWEEPWFEDLRDLLLAEYEVEEDIAAKDAKAIAERWKEIGIAED